ncbi:predicted protein [Phaeodactylum tricornutum CCAP 1055/1]|jgi:hypothetical protein|uniref:Uncharacterized protein n=1 Tax=Phaeodactylum tricornutum (strain CCAP 1055/1) TaxID=556484 RepID=B7G734_PHATC|nr:predicted protein [Phaeodactylum tricornutum CCAP 1055/1]EEC45570.1 predicted protein [Phaeodactylum tricornutum CCAP 1055/1]|eukprot:XP_002182834.1 predicted protein [Phaeodactylum tricornutum CCAP 1055/1]
MGGDGGVIASNRRYMRGAGAADHTGDSARQTKLDPAVEKEEIQRSMKFCALSGQPLEFGKQTIVVCPYGRLYHKEAAVEALLRRKQTDQDELGGHIRGLKDLHEVHFSLLNSMPICPITGNDLNGNIPAYVVIPGKPDEVNALSKKGMEQVDKQTIVADYGPIERKIRLAPPAAILDILKNEIIQKNAEEKISRELKRGLKKRKRIEGEVLACANK